MPPRARASSRSRSPTSPSSSISLSSFKDADENDGGVGDPFQDADLVGSIGSEDQNTVEKKMPIKKRRAVPDAIVKWGDVVEVEGKGGNVVEIKGKWGDVVEAIVKWGDSLLKSP